MVGTGLTPIGPERALKIRRQQDQRRRREDQSLLENAMGDVLAQVREEGMNTKGTNRMKLIDSCMVSLLASPRFKQNAPNTHNFLKLTSVHRLANSVAPLPKKSRHRAAIITQLIRGECWLTEKELLHACEVNSSYLRVKARDEQKKLVNGKVAIPPLYSEQIKAHTELTNETVAEEEKLAIRAYAESQMLIRSGTNTLTFRLGEAKGHFVEKFRAAYPRILRKLIREHSVLRANDTTKVLTIFHRNVEHALWLADVPGFVEGEAADEAQREYLRKLLGKSHPPILSTKLAGFDPATWVIIPRYKLPTLSHARLYTRVARRHWSLIICSP